MAVEQPRIRIFLLANGKRVAHQFVQAQVDAFLLDNSGSTLVR
jgi:hypothetical protein